MSVDVNLNYHWSATPQITTGNPQTVNDATQQNPLGMVTRWKGDIYRYVKFTEGGVTGIARGAVYWVLLAPASGTWTVVADQSDCLASGSVQMVAGVLGTQIPTDAYFCWIQVGGLALATKVTAAKAAGSRVVGGTVDLTFSTISTATTPGTLATTYLAHYGVMVTASTTAATANILLANLDW